MSRNFLTKFLIGGKAPFCMAYTIPGAIAVSTGLAPFPVPRDITVTNIRVAGAGSNSSGTSYIFDVKLNGGTVYGTNPGNRPTIVNTASEDVSGIPDTVNWSMNSTVTIDVVQIGAGITDAVIVVEYQ